MYLPMKVAHTVDELVVMRRAIQKPSIGLVPTMGALHRGHMNVIDQAGEENDSVVVSIFVNPAQFGPDEDFDQYPRRLQRDLQLLQDTGHVDLVFAPNSILEMYPVGCNTHVKLGPEIDAMLEAKQRPGHLNGVATIVTKLFNLIRPKRAYFGLKDAAQCIAVKKLARDLNFMPELQVIIADTVREDDGLALSSRNTYLSEKERRIVPSLYKGLKAGKAMFHDASSRSGEIDPDTIKAHVKKAILEHAEQTQQQKHIPIHIEYVSLMDMTTAVELRGHLYRSGPNSPLVLSCAIQLPSTRLIDAILLHS